MEYLIDVAQRTLHFIFGTGSDHRSNNPAIIQIFFQPLNQESSPMIVVEINYLPDDSSLLKFNIFSFPILSFIHNTQTTFAIWFDDW